MSTITPYQYSFDDLPDEIVGIIWNYLSPFVKRQLNSELYVRYHGCIIAPWRTQRYFSYIRFLIRNTCIFPLRTVLERDGHHMVSLTRYQANSYMPKIPYLSYLIALCIEQGDTKCREIIRPLLDGLTKKRYRKVKRPHNRQWTN